MYYGYNFTKQNSCGLGAILHDVMNANIYAEQNNLIFCFTKEGYEIPRLNGSIIDNNDLYDKVWHSYFTSFQIIESDKCVKIWPDFLPNTQLIKCGIEEYSNILKNKICLFDSTIENQINELVKKTPFSCETDIVLHIRMTDKSSENVFLPIEKYIDECEHILLELKNEKNRIYICTDNKKICIEIKNYFDKKNIEVVWDDKESDDQLQYLRWTNKLEKSIAQKETMNAFKNLFIMKHAKYLIGGRMSYFFRIGELLQYPKKAINIQDNDKFGIAPYSSINYMIRPYKKKTFSNFINSDINNNDLLKKYNDEYIKTNIISIPNFISENVLNQIIIELNNYQWWRYAIIPNNNIWESKNYALNDPFLENCFKECNEHLENKYFCYRFKRDFGNHYNTCYCVACKLYDTISSFPTTDLLCKIVGCRNLIPGEMFISNYGKGDFLNVHHDIKKGDISVTFSLNDNWDCTYGGILHFCDKERNIYKSISKTQGAINIFKINIENGIDHFVSQVVVNKNRYTLTAWYNIIN
jgi:hypothetical protein